MVNRHPIDPTYKKENGMWNLLTDKIPMPQGFEVVERSIVYIPAGAYGGNHKHPRREAFVGIGSDLFIVWLDKDGLTHEDKMMEDEQLYMFDVEPHTPHALINKGSGFAVLVELATGANIQVEPIDVLNI